jgi:hypothetical protein
LTTKVDLVMWAKNGASFLPWVLKQIDKVIPSENVSSKIFVDDQSTDMSAKIGKDFNWVVYPNPAGGISSGANEALRHVKSSRFISIEQDVVLAKDWWGKIPQVLEKNNNVAIVSGVRIPDKPASLRKIEEYTTDRYERETLFNPAYRYGKTIDNTLYRTEVLKKTGGFPRLKINAGVDGALVKQINNAGYSWSVDFSVRSIHLRKGVLGEMRHGYWYGSESAALEKTLNEQSNVVISTFTKAAFSPFRAINIASKKKCWQILYLYPLLRSSVFAGTLKSKLSRKGHN